MNKDTWLELKQKIKNDFGISDEFFEDLDPGQAEVIEFDGPMGKMLLKYISRPKIVDKQTLYANRIGSGVRVNYSYDESQTVNTLEAFLYDESSSQWRKIDAEKMMQ